MMESLCVADNQMERASLPNAVGNLPILIDKLMFINKKREVLSRFFVHM